MSVTATEDDVTATEDDVTAGIAAMSLSNAAVLNDDVLAAIALELAALDLPNSFHRDFVGRGARELAAISGVCRSWRRVLVATDAVWLRIIEARYPRLMLGSRPRCLPQYPPSRELAHLRLTFREHFLVQADVERLRAAPRSAPPRSPDNYKLQDFTFTLEAKCASWSSVMLDEDDEVDRRDYPEGTFVSWTGTFEGFGHDVFSDRLAFLGNLGIGGLETLVSVYVTTPSLQTFKIYFDGTHHYSDWFFDETVDFYTSQPLPYAHEQPTIDVFALHLSGRAGHLSFEFTCDCEMDEEDVLTYLRGEAIPVDHYGG